MMNTVFFSKRGLNKKLVSSYELLPLKNMRFLTLGILVTYNFSH
jgi:hypothetical protein